jgi:hypothetical protein
MSEPLLRLVGKASVAAESAEVNRLSRLAEVRLHGNCYWFGPSIARSAN